MKPKLIKVISHKGIGDYCHDSKEWRDVLEFVYSDGSSKFSPKIEKFHDDFNDKYDAWRSKQVAI